MSDKRQQQVVVAYDFSETADLALERAIDIACRAPWHMLHFVAVIERQKGFGIREESEKEKVDLGYMEEVQSTLSQRLESIFKGFHAPEDVTFFVHVRMGHAAKEIIGLAEEVGADMIIVGSHGRTGIKRLFMGSVSEHVARAALCPVIVVRAKGYDDIELSEMVEVEPGSKGPGYRKPHRYSYNNNIVTRHSKTWALN